MFSYNVKLQKKIAEKRIKDKERREKGHARSFDLVLKMWKENERESKRGGASEEESGRAKDRERERERATIAGEQRAREQRAQQQ